VLLVVRAEAAIQRATVAHFGGELQRERAGLVVAGNLGIELGVAKNEGFELAVLRASLPHDYFVVPEQYVRVYHLPAYGTEAFGEFPEDFGAVLFNNRHERVMSGDVFCQQLDSKVSHAISMKFRKSKRGIDPEFGLIQIVSANHRERPTRYK
jgi:hypothetical protein